MEALIVAVLAVGVLVIAPIVSSLVLFLRTRALRAEVNGLGERVRRLERGLAPDARSAERARGAEPASGTGPAPVMETAAPTAPRARTAAAASPTAEARPAFDAPRRPPASVASAGPHESPAASSAPESLESRIGGRWLLNIGIAAIVIGVAYFEKLAIDNNWIGETARVIQGGILGAILVYAGRRFARAGYSAYGQMIIGGGIAVMYVSTYAAFNYYRLIDRPTAFVTLVAITALGAFLADRHNSQGLAIFAVGGGFATPFLLPGNTDAQLVLFSYDAILIAGTVFLAGRRHWPFLHVVSYVFTLLTVAGWAERFYDPSKYLRTELFLTLFCAMFVAIAVRCRRSGRAPEQAAAAFLWTAPIAYYLASLVILAPHAIALLVWFICLMLVGGVLSIRTRAWAGLAIWIAVAVPLLGWTQAYGGPAWLVAGLATIAGVYVIALAAQLQIITNGEERRAAHPIEIAWMHLNGLSMFAAAYFLLEDTHVAATGPLAAALAAWHGLLAWRLLERYRDHALHFAALALSLLAIAVALQFDGPAVTIGWAFEGAAIVALGLRERRHWLRAAGAVLFAVAVVRTLDVLLTIARANHVVILNSRAASALAVIALSYGLAWLHRRHRDSGVHGAGANKTAFGSAITAAVLVAQFVSVVLLTSEIRAFFGTREGAFTREMTISVTWAAYATALIVVGLYRRYPPVRYFGIALFGITILKVFFGDLSQLERIYRVLSIMGLGVLLLLTSYLYQRMRDTLRVSHAGSGEPPAENG